MKKDFIKKIFYSLISLIAVVFVLNAVYVFAEGVGYTILEDLPGVTYESGKDNAFSGYLSGMLKLVISFAVVLAILQMSRAGFEYMTTEAFTGKGAAKGRINNALYGLAVAFGAFLVLNFINPDLVNIDLSLPEVKVDEYVPPSSPPPGQSEAEARQVYIDDYAPKEVLFNPPIEGSESNCGNSRIKRNNKWYHLVANDPNVGLTKRCVYVAE